MSDTLGARVAQLDAAAFVGRRAELDVLEAFLTSADGPSVAMIWGQGGVGKSTLLREVQRRANAAGREVHRIDASELPPAADRLDELIGALDLGDRAVLLIDSYERIGVLANHLRRVVLPSLPGSTRVLLAGRRGPDSGWRADGWDAAFLPLPLGPFDDDEGRELLARRGMVEPDMVDVVLRWGRGLPLALSIAAQASRRPSARFDPLHADLDAELASALLVQLVGDEVEEIDRAVIAVAAVAPRCDSSVLVAALPGADPESALRCLRGASFVEETASGFVMHERVRSALRVELHEDDPHFERELRRRVVDNLHDRAFLGEPWLLHEIVQLVDDPMVRWGLGGAAGDRSDGVISDRLRPGDAAALAAALDRTGQGWWPGVERWLRDAPDHVVVIRQGARLVGAAILATPTWSPPWVGDDTIVGPWLEHAACTDAGPETFVMRDAFDLGAASGDGPSPVIAVANAAAFMRSGLSNVRRCYCHCAPEDATQREFLERLGHVRVPELDISDGGRRLHAFVLDYGPGGAVSALRDLIYAEIGLAPLDRREGDEVTAEVVRDAVRAFHDPLALSRLPLARGSSTDERATAVRARIMGALDVVFGDSPDEQLQRRVLEEGYLNPDGGHAHAARVLHLSRSTYYRRLAAATDRLGDHLAAEC